MCGNRERRGHLDPGCLGTSADPHLPGRQSDLSQVEDIARSSASPLPSGQGGWCCWTEFYLESLCSSATILMLPFWPPAYSLSTSWPSSPRYFTGISSLFARYFPFTHFLSLSLCLAATGITRVWGFKVRFSFLSSTPRTRMWSWSVYCLHPESQDQVPVLKERALKNQGGQKSVYGRSVREASVYILSAADRRTGLVWPLFLLNNWILESLESQLG